MANDRMRVIVLGFDAASLWLIKPWIAAGHLPAFSSLVAGGVSGNLASSIPYVSSAAWATFATGKQPGKHGIYDFATRRPNSYDVRLVDARDVAGETLWSILTRNGQRVVVANVPMTYPPQEVNGYLIAGMLTPSTDHPFTHPPELRDRLVGRFPDYVIEPSRLSPDRRRSKESVARRVRLATRQRAQLLSWLAEEVPDWELLLVVWTGTDRIQHYLWDDMDPDHPRHDARLAGEFGREILEHFRELDRILGDVLETVVDERTVLFVVSDHGMGGVHRSLYPNCWLEREGYLRLKRGQPRVSQLQVLKRVLVRLGIAHLVKEMYRRARPSYEATTKLRHGAFRGDIDWHRTRAYWGVDNALCLNVRGRQPEGIVEPGEEYERLCEELKRKLLNLRDPVTGELVIESVYHRSELYHGPRAVFGPDLTVVWQEYPDQRKTYAAAGELWGPGLFGETDQTASHTRHGVLLARGEPLRRGYQLTGAGIVDVAPTILHVLGVSVPDDMDGRVLTDVFTESWLRDHPVRFAPASTGGSTRGERAPATNGDGAVYERLRDLGYVD